MNVRYAGFSLLAGIAGCQSDPVFCDCGAYGIGIAVPPDRFDDVSSVTASGPGCSSDVLPNGPHVYWVSGRAEGVCHIEITFESGAPKFTSDAEVTFHREGCCSGYMADPVFVPALDASAPESDANGSDASGDAPEAD